MGSPKETGHHTSLASNAAFLYRCKVGPTKGSLASQKAPHTHTDNFGRHLRRNHATSHEWGRAILLPGNVHPRSCVHKELDNVCVTILRGKEQRRGASCFAVYSSTSCYELLGHIVLTEPACVEEV